MERFRLLLVTLVLSFFVYAAKSTDLGDITHMVSRFFEKVQNDREWGEEDLTILKPVLILIGVILKVVEYASTETANRIAESVTNAAAVIGDETCVEDKPGSYCFINRWEIRDAFCETQGLYEHHKFSLFFGTCYCGVRENSTNTAPNEGEHCGSLEMDLFDNKTQTIANVSTEGKYNLQRFSAIRTMAQKLDDKTVSMEILSDEYEISVCGINTARIPATLECFKTNETASNFAFDTNQKFEMTSISCGKKQQDFESCQTTRCTEHLLSEEECGALYQEENCSGCRYPKISLLEGRPFNTEYVAVIRSLVVKKDCTVKVNGGQEEYTGSNGKIPLLFDMSGNNTETLHLFECSCKPKLSKTVTIILSVGLPILFFTTVGLAIWLKKRKRKVKFTLTETEDLKMELFAPQKDSIEVCENKVKENTSPSVSFDAKFTIKKGDIEKSSELLGKGNFGCVFKGRFKQLGKQNVEVAIKTVDEFTATISDLNLLINEIRVMSHMGSHPNIVSFIGAYYNFHPTKWEILCVMELCSENLHEHLLKERETFFATEIVFDQCKELNLGTLGYLEVGCKMKEHSSKEHCNRQRLHCQWCLQIADGMEYLSNKKVLHVDLATRNVLLTEKLVAKISDFGLSKKLYQKSYYKKEQGKGKMLLPLKWTALESLMDFKFSSKSDVWSYGVTIWEIFSLGEEPYPGVSNISDLLTFLYSGKRLEQPTTANANLYELMLKCWVAEPENRPTFSELTSFFDDFGTEDNAQDQTTLFHVTGQNNAVSRSSTTMDPYIRR